MTTGQRMEAGHEVTTAHRLAAIAAIADAIGIVAKEKGFSEKDCRAFRRIIWEICLSDEVEQ